MADDTPQPKLTLEDWCTAMGIGAPEGTPLARVRPPALALQYMIDMWEAYADDDDDTPEDD